MTPAAGIHPGVPFHVYAQWDAVNHSLLKHFERSPLHAKHAIENPREQTQALLMGHALHVATFEPARFAEEFCIIPEFNCSTTVGKEGFRNCIANMIGRDLSEAETKLRKEELLELGKLEGRKTILDEGDFAELQGMGTAIRSSRVASHYVNAPGQCEVSCLWKDDSTGLLCKGRFDKLIPRVIVELKSCRNAKAGPFGRDCANFFYHAQAAHYVAGHPEGGQKHVIIAVESKPPHGVAVYSLSARDLQSGELLRRRWLNDYADAVATGEWPGYPDEVLELELPGWAQQQEEVA